MKRIVSIQDISCLGKCSLTVALPILSAMGVECAIVPTAVLSTHTMFQNFTCKDLSDQIAPIAAIIPAAATSAALIYVGVLMLMGLKNLNFELAGIVEDGVKYGTKQSYMKAKGILPDGSTTTQAILSGRDGATGSENSKGTRGSDYIVKGTGIMALGEDGVSDWRIGLTSVLDVTTYVTDISTNTANLVIFTIPNDLAEGQYTLTIETYFSPTGLRKEPIKLTAPFTLTLEL